MKTGFAIFIFLLGLIILITVVIVFYSWRFNRSIQNEISQLFSNISPKQVEIINPESLGSLPPPVQLWLHKTGIVGKKGVTSAKISQKGKLRTTPKQEWMDFTANHYVTVDDPAFIWKADIKMNPLMSLVGRDKFVNGKGSMLIKLLSVINVADASGNDKINQAALQRYLGEIVWYPTAALSPYIQWEAIDSTTAKATMTYNGTEGSAFFHFHPDGTLDSFYADRYKESGTDAPLERWHVQAKGSKEMNGLLIPVRFDVTWKLASGDFHWMELEVVEIEYFIFG